MKSNRIVTKPVNPAVDDPDNDDEQIGQILSRREVLRLLGISGAALLAGCAVAQPGSSSTPEAAAPTSAAAAEPTTAVTAVPACVVRPEVTEGPWHNDTGYDNIRRPIPDNRRATTLCPPFCLDVMAKLLKS